MMNEDSLAKFRDFIEQYNKADPERLENARIGLIQLKMALGPEFSLMAAQMAAESFSESKTVFMCLCALKDALTPRRLHPKHVLKSWFEPFDGLQSIQSVLFLFLGHQDEALRNLAGVNLALLLQITMDFTLLERIRKQASEVALCVFREILQLNLFCDLDDASLSSVIPDLDAFFEIIVNALTSEPSDKIRAAKCLKLFIRNVPKKFAESDSNIFPLIESLLPSSNLQLYRDLHFCLLELVKSNYDTADNFMARIFNITSIGMQCELFEFRIISLHFWRVLWDFELAEIKKRKRVGFSYNQFYPSLTLAASQSLIPIAIQMLSIENSSTVNSFSFLTLQGLVEAVSMGSDNSEVIAGLCRAAEGLLADDNLAAVDLAISIVRSAIIKEGKYGSQTESELSAFLERNWQQITASLFSDIPKVAQNAASLVMSVISRFPVAIMAESAFSGLLQIVTRIMSGSGEFVALGLRLFCFLVCKGPIQLIDRNFSDMFDMIHKVFLSHGDEFDVSRHIVPAFVALIEHSSQRANPVLIAYFVQMLDVLPEWCSESRKADVLVICHTIIQKVRHNLEIEIILKYCLRLFGILQNSASVLWEESLEGFTVIFAHFGRAFEPYVGPFTIIIGNAFASKIPRLVGLAASCLGEFCRAFERDAATHVMSEIEALFGLLQDMLLIDEGYERNAAPRMLIGMSVVIKSIPNELGVEQVKRYWSINSHFAATVIRKGVKNDICYAIDLFDAVCQGFAAALEAALAIDGNIKGDKSFVAEVKAMFAVFDQIWELGAWNDESLFGVLELLDVLAGKFGRLVSVALRRRPVKNLMFVASKSPDSCVSGLWQKVQREIDNT
jgi:hypothetical protein